MADEKAVPTLEQIKGVLTETVAPISAKVEAVEQTLRGEIKAAADSVVAVKTELEAKIAAIGAAPEGYVDADGRPFNPRGKGGAPAHVHEYGDKPVTLADVVKYFYVDHDEKKYPLLMHIDRELQECGHIRTQTGKSVVFPLTPDAALIPVPTPRSEKLHKLLRDAMPVREDMEFTSQLWKSFLTNRVLTKQMDPNDDALGGSLIPLPPSGDLITLLRNQTVFGRVGAEMITLPPSGSIRYPRETGTTTFYWVDANETITHSTAATGSLQMTAKRLGGVVRVPNDLIRYGQNVEGFLRRALTLDAGLAEDLAFLEGEGGGTKPTGLITMGRSANATPTADLVTLSNASTTAANGDTLEPQDPLRAIGLIETAPDAEGPTAFIMRPMMFVALANRRIDQGGGAGTGDFVFKDMHMLDGAVRKQLRGLPVVTSTQVNKTSRKGSGTTLTYVICINGRRVKIGHVGTVELATSEHAGFEADQTYIRAILRCDMTMSYKQSAVIIPTLLES